MVITASSFVYEGKISSRADTHFVCPFLLWWVFRAPNMLPFDSSLSRWASFCSCKAGVGLAPLVRFKLQVLAPLTLSCLEYVQIGVAHTYPTYIAWS